MSAPLSLSEIFTTEQGEAFEKRALSVFYYQAENCRIYREFIDLLGIKPENVKSLRQIPFMPVTFFRDHLVICGEEEPEAVFGSSGTSGLKQSRHAVRSLKVYNESLLRAFSLFYGLPSEYAIMGLLPSYLERRDSSLVYMVKKLIDASGNDAGGFFLGDPDSLFRAVDGACAKELKVMLLGVTYALLDLAESHPCDLSDVIIMETGGMKGRRREMIRHEVHTILKAAFGVRSVHSEYGMTELLSQSYSKGEGLFMTPPWMKVLIRDSNDPQAHTTVAGASGGISIIDLANIYSCAFIATSDLGRMHADGSFEVLGRFDNADVRGCNLLYG